MRAGEEPAVGPMTLVLPPAAAARRADRVVADAVRPLAQSFVQRLIEEGRLTAGGRAVKSNTVLEPGTEAWSSTFRQPTRRSKRSRRSRSTSSTKTRTC